MVFVGHGFDDASMDNPIVQNSSNSSQVATFWRFKVDMVQVPNVMGFDLKPSLLILCYVDFIIFISLFVTVFSFLESHLYPISIPLVRGEFLFDISLKNQDDTRFVSHHHVKIGVKVNLRLENVSGFFL